MPNGRNPRHRRRFFEAADAGVLRLYVAAGAKVAGRIRVGGVDGGGRAWYA